MKQGELIIKTISSLKQRLVESDGLLRLQLEVGYLTEGKCTFSTPAAEEDLKKKFKMA